MAHDKLKIVPQYIKNISKSAVYATGDIVSQIMPNIGNFASTNADIMKSVSNDLRNTRSIVRQAKSSWNNSETSKAVRNIKKNFLDDIKTGKIYNKERQNKANLEASGFADVFDMSDFDFLNDDNSGTDNSAMAKVNATIANSTNSSIKAGAIGTMNAIEANAKVVSTSMMTSATMIVENQSAINNTNMVLNQKMFGEINGVLSDMDKNIRGLFDHTANIDKYFNESMRMYESMTNSMREMAALNKEYTEMQRNLYAEYNKSKNTMQLSKDTNDFISNGFDIAGYLKSVKNRAVDQYKGSMLGSMTNMLGDDTNLLKSLEGSPAKFLLTLLSGRIVSKPLQDSMKNLDKTAGNFFQSLLFKYSSKLKEAGETNDLFNTLYKTIGLNLGQKQVVNSSAYIKGPIPYNGYADKAIVEVTQTYLRKILAAITGEKEMIYNYETGRFMNNTEIKKKYKIEEETSYNMGDWQSHLRSTINDSFIMSNSDMKLMDKTISKFTKFMVDTGHFFSMNDDYDKLMEMGYDGDTSATNILLGALRATDKQKLMELNQSQLDAIRKRKDSIADINNKLSVTGFGSLFNNSNSMKVKSPLLSTVDKYNKSSVDYLRDIRTILLEGIKVYSVNIMGKHVKNNGNSITDLDRRMERYNSEVAQLNNSSKTYFDEEQDLRNRAKNSTKRTISVLGSISGPDYYENIFKNDADLEKIRQNTNNNTEVGKFMSRFKLFSKANDSIKNLAEAARNMATAPEKALITLFDSINDNLLYMIYGVKDKHGRTFLDKVVDNANNMTDKVYTYLLGNIIDPLKKAILGENGLVTKMKKRMSPIVERVKNKKSSFFGKLSNRLFGSMTDGNMSPKEFFDENIKPRLKETGIGAGIGLAASFVTPLGIIGGPLLGATVGFASTSERVKNLFFGKFVDGSRQGGIVPKKILDQLSASNKNIKIGAGVGAAVGLLTPLGLVGSTLIGGTLGFASKMDVVQDVLFGKMVNGTRDSSSALISKEWQEKIKTLSPKALKGAGLGVLGSFFLPVGPIGGALLGLTTAIGLQSEKIKTYLFGKEDPETGKRFGGLMGKMSMWLKTEIALPFKNFVQNTFVDVKHFVQENIFDRIANMFTPFKLKIQEDIKAGWETTKSFIGGVFEKHVGKPFGELMQEKFIDPMKKIFSKIFGTIGNVIGKTIGAPFKFLDNKATKMMEDRKNNGEIDTYYYWIKDKARRQKKTQDEYNKKKAEINRDNYRENAIRNYLRKNGYSEEAMKHAMEARNLRAKNSMQEAIKDNTNKTNDILKEGLGILKDIYKAFSSSAAESLHEFMNARKLNSRTQKHNFKHTVKTPRVIHLASSIEETRKMNAEDSGQTHAGGLDYVPEDDYNANLHKGEMVIPADEANYLRKLLGVPQKSKTTKKGRKGDTNGFVNNISNLFGRRDKEHKLLDNINNNVIKIYNRLTQKDKDDKNSDLSLLKDIRNDTRVVKDNVNNQIINVGYHAEYIANIMTDIFGAPKNLPKGIRAGIHSIRGFFTKIFGAIKKPIDFILKPFKMVNNVLTSMADKLTNIVTKIIEIPSNIIKGITKIGTKLVGVANTIVKGTFDIMGSVAKSIPKVVSVITTGANQMLKITGNVLKGAAVGLGKMLQYTMTGLGKFVSGVGSMTKNIISATGKLTKSLVDLSVYIGTKVVKTIGKATKSILKAIGNVTTSAWNLITSPFTKKNKKGVDISRQINYVKTVNLVNRVKLIDRITSVGTIEKIADKTLYNKLDKLIKLQDTNHNPKDDIDNNLRHPYSKFTEDARKNISSKEDTESGVAEKFRQRISSLSGKAKPNTQLQIFTAKENAEEQTKQFKLRKKLEESSMKSEIGTHGILKKAFGPKGIFGMLGTILSFAVPLLGKLKSKVKDLFSSLFKDFAGNLIGKFKSWASPLFEKLLGKLNFNPSGGFNNFSNTPIHSTPITGGYLPVNVPSFKGGLPGTTVAKIPGLPQSTGTLLLPGAASVATKGTKGGKIGQLFSKIKNKGGELLGKVSSLFGNKGAQTIATNTLGDISQQVASYTASEASRPLLNGTVSSIMGNTTKANSSIISKIFSSKALQKICGSKIGSVLKKVGEFISKSLAGKVTASFFAKLGAKWSAIIGSGAISAGIIPAIWYGGEIINSVSATNKIFQMSPNYKPSALMKTIAGVAEFISINITFGLVSPTTIAQYIASLVMDENDSKKLEDAQTQLKNEYDSYVKESGDNSITLEEYNKKVNKSLLNKAWDGVKSGAGWIKDKASGAWDTAKEVVGNIGDKVKDGADTLNATIGAIFGLEDEEGNPLNFTEWAGKKASGAWEGIKSGAGWIKDKAHDVWEGAKDLWGKTSEFFGGVKDNINDGIETANENIGSLLGLQDRDGNSTTFSAWLGDKASDACDWIKEKVSNAWEGAKGLWGDLSSGLESLKEKAKSGLKSADESIGSMLGLEDSSGNSTTLSGWVGDKWNSFSNWVGNKWDSFKNSIKVRKRYNSGSGMGTSQSARALSKKAGAGFGESPEIVNNAAYWRQGDDRWRGESYGTGTIGATGCGPTSASMLISSVTDTIITPKQAADWSVAHGYRVPGVGTSWGFFPAFGKEYGVNLTPTTDQNALQEALRSGRPAILSGQGGQPFTKGGHLIMAVGMDSNGKIIINDPVSKERSTTYDFASVMSNTAQAWISDKPLKNGISGVSSDASSSGTSASPKEEDTNPFLSAIQKIGTYSLGFISDSITGKVFDASKYDNPSGTSNTSSGSDTSGVGSANSSVGSATAIEKVGSATSSQVPGLSSTMLSNLNKILPTAVYNYKTTGMLPSLTLGQAMGESSMGTAGIAVNGATNNWYGHSKSSLGDGSSGNWDVYSTPARGAASHINWFKFAAYNGYSDKIYSAKNYRDAVRAIADSPYCGDGSDYYSLITSSISAHKLDQWDNGSTAGVPDMSSAGSGNLGTPGGLDLTVPRSLAIREKNAKHNYKPMNYKLINKLGAGAGNGPDMNNSLLRKMKSVGNGPKPYDSSQFAIRQAQILKESANTYIEKEANNTNNNGIEQKLDILINLISTIAGDTSILTNIVQTIANKQTQQVNNNDIPVETKKETNTQTVNKNERVMNVASSQNSKNNSIYDAYKNAQNIAKGILS